MVSGHAMDPCSAPGGSLSIVVGMKFLWRTWDVCYNCIIVWVVCVCVACTGAMCMWGVGVVGPGWLGECVCVCV